MQNETQVVKQEELTSSPDSEVEETQEQEPETTEEVAEKPAQAGDKTPNNELLKSLQDEKDKRRRDEVTIKQLKEDLEQAQTSTPTEELSEEGKVLQDKLTTLEANVSTLTEEGVKKDILIEHPILKDKWDLFEEFRLKEENDGMNMKTAAKAFLIDNGLYETRRKGLEKPTGGTKASSTPGTMTTEEAKDLRENHYKKYMEMIESGKLVIKD